MVFIIVFTVPVIFMEASTYVNSVIFIDGNVPTIKKGMEKLKEHPDRWEVPYLPIDPVDVGRSYDPIIRINSQSGKGGVAFILENNFGLTLPKSLQQDFSLKVTSESVKRDKELTPSEIMDLFMDTYYVKDPITVKYYDEQARDDKVDIDCELVYNGKNLKITESGNGIVDAFSKILTNITGVKFNVANYSEHSMEYGNKSRAITYVQIFDENHNPHYGIGTSMNIAKSSLRAIASAVNRLIESKK